MLRNMTGYRTLARNHDFTVLWVGQTVCELGTPGEHVRLPAARPSRSPARRWRPRPPRRCTSSAWPAPCCRPASWPTGSTGVRLLRTSSAAGVLLYASLAVAGVAGALTLPHLLVVAALTGVAAGVFMPAETAAVRAVVGTDELPTALSQARPASTSRRCSAPRSAACCTPRPAGCRSRRTP